MPKLTDQIDSTTLIWVVQFGGNLVEIKNQPNFVQSVWLVFGQDQLN